MDSSNEHYKELELEIAREKELVFRAGVAPENANAVAAVAVFRRLQSGAKPLAEPEPSNMSFKVPETIVDWLENFIVDSHVDKFVAAAVYLRQHRDALTVHSDSILWVYGKARWEKPKNPADVFYRAAKQKLFAEADDDQSTEATPKKWQLTRAGLSHFESLRKDNKNGRQN